MKFICLEMLRLLVISFTTIEWNLEAMFMMLLMCLFSNVTYTWPYSIVIVM